MKTVIIPITLTLQLKPEKLETIRSWEDVAIGPVDSDHPSGHQPEDDINAHPKSPSVLYPTHQLNAVHLLSQLATLYSHL